MKKLLTLLCVLTLACGLGSLQAAAETTEPQKPGEAYTYTVRIFAGKRGTFRTDISYGDNVTVTKDCITVKCLQDGADAALMLPIRGEDGVNSIANIVTLTPEGENTPSRYYVQGFRLSGRDNNATGDGAADARRTTTISGQAQANGDLDYVVAYGIKGQLVYYTVRYVGPDGRELLTADRYQGNVGDKPVVSYRYIEGYLPQAYQLKMTLTENEADNVFIFSYTPVGGVIVQNETVTDYGTTVVEVPGTVTGAGGVIGGGGAGGGAAAGPGAGAAVVGPDAGPGGGAVDIPPNDTPQNQAPQEIIDLDEGESALGSLTLDEDTTNRMGLFGGVVAAMAGVAGLGWLLWFLFIGRKRRKDEDEA